MTAATDQLPTTVQELGLPVVPITRRPLDVREYRLRSAKMEDVRELVEKPCIITENGRVKIVYLHLNDVPGVDLDPVMAACDRIRYDTSTRTTGMISTSRIFGYEPRKTLRKDFCGSVSLAVDSPDEHEIICGAARLAAHFYRLTNPELYRKHVDIVANKVLAEYHLHNTVFTSGIVNHNNPLPYHFDAGNFASVWSAMFVFKRDIAEGYLACPQYDRAFALPHNSLFMFDGQGLLHGVTPIKQLKETSKRYSIVFYSLAQMWQCLTPQAELERIRSVKTRRERKRAGLPEQP